MKHLVWIDTDTGVDDAIALLTAFSLEEMEVVGISAVAGNVPLAHTFENARNVTALAGKESIPVYPGAEKPLLRPLVTAEEVHGKNGLGGAVIPESSAERETKKAWDAIYDAACRYPNELELILIGPETNAAIALFKYPDLKHLLKRILVMGGAAIGGNATPAAEFNIYADPHAAKAVFSSGIPVVMCGLDVTNKAKILEEECRVLDAFDSSACHLFKDSTSALRKYRPEGGIVVHDACPILFVARPDLFQFEEAGVVVETESSLCMGQTVTDLYTDYQFEKKNAVVATDINRRAFAEILMHALKMF